MKWIGYFLICHVFVFKCFAMSITELQDFSNFLIETSQLDQNVKSNIPRDDFDEDEPISDNAWEKSGKFEGDLILNEKQRKMILTNVAEGLARNGLTDSTKRWPNNEVVYFIQPEHFNLDQMQAIQDGIDDLARVSCVKFRPYVKGDKDAVVIQGSRRGCFSQVGYQGGYQVVNLSRRHPAGRGCFRHGTVVHELLHTLGFYHMQSSPDRDDYIDVLYENIIKPARHNFRKYSSFAVSDFGIGYDYDSVLHYSRKAFSANGQDTIVPKKLGAQIGQRIGLSDKDIQKLNKMYCDADLLLEDSSDRLKKSEKLTLETLSAEQVTSDKNKPFEGHGLGYEKGKMIIIRLPRPEKRQMQDLPHIPIFDYFSKTTQELPPAIIQAIGDGREENLNIHAPLLYDKKYIKSVTTHIPHEQYDNRDFGGMTPDDKDKNALEGVYDTFDGDFHILSNIEKPKENAFQLNPIQLHEEDNNSDPRKLGKEQEISSFHTHLLSAVGNDNGNHFAVDGPIHADFNQLSQQNYQNNERNSNKQDPSRIYSFDISDPIAYTQIGSISPIQSVSYRKNNMKHAKEIPIAYYSPLTKNGQLNYSYLSKNNPPFEKWSDRLTYESYRHRNPKRVNQYR